MKKKNTARDNLNLFISAFLIIAYVVCGYFFYSFISVLSGELLKNLLMSLIFAVFGVIVFYATRVGEGKTIKRFSLVTLIVLDLPALYIILAFAIAGLPFHNELAETAVVPFMAAIALGYGIPYTFLSGFETVSEDDETGSEKPVRGVIEEELDEAFEEASEAPSYDADVDEIVVEGTAVIEE